MLKSCYLLFEDKVPGLEFAVADDVGGHLFGWLEGGCNGIVILFSK